MVAPAARERIARLRVPPAWRDVCIAPRAEARLQAVGRDAAGRWQYWYRAEYSAARARRKFDRMPAFARALPALRATLRRDLARPGMPLERACAAAVLLLTAASLRPGAERYERLNGTIGLATLRPQHVRAQGGVVRLAFRGKHGVSHQLELRGARLARLVRELLRLPGRELLKYREAGDRVCDLRTGQLNTYVKRVMGARFTAKDFRTWGATLMCAGVLQGPAPPARVASGRGNKARDAGVAAAREAAIRHGIATTARWLGNTPSVTRESYVHPEVLEAYRKGRVVAHALTRPEMLAERLPRGLHAAERAVLRLIDRP